MTGAQRRATGDSGRIFGRLARTDPENGIPRRPCTRWNDLLAGGACLGLDRVCTGDVRLIGKILAQLGLASYGNTDKA